MKFSVYTPFRFFDDGHFCVKTQTHIAAPSAIGCCSQKFHQMRNSNVGYTIRIPRQRCRCTNKQTQNGTHRAHWFVCLLEKEKRQLDGKNEHEPISFHISMAVVWVCVCFYRFFRFLFSCVCMNCTFFVFWLSLSLAERRKLCCSGCPGIFLRFAVYICVFPLSFPLLRRVFFRFIHVWWECATLISS